jgi:hypothetical protein
MKIRQARKVAARVFAVREARHRAKIAELVGLTRPTREEILDGWAKKTATAIVGDLGEILRQAQRARRAELIGPQGRGPYPDRTLLGAYRKLHAYWRRHRDEVAVGGRRFLETTDDYHRREAVVAQLLDQDMSPRVFHALRRNLDPPHS